MTVTHVGSTKQYSQSWDNIFPGKSGKANAKPAAGKKTAEKPVQKAAKKASKKAAKPAAKKAKPAKAKKR